MPARAASDFPTRCLRSTCSSITWSGCECRLERPKGWKPSFRFRPRLPKVEHNASCPPPGRWGSEEEKVLGHSELGPCSSNFQANCFEEGVVEHPCSFPQYGPVGRAAGLLVESDLDHQARPNPPQAKTDHEAAGTMLPSATSRRSSSFCNFPVGPCGNSITNAISSGNHHFGTDS